MKNLKQKSFLFKKIDSIWLQYDDNQGFDVTSTQIVSLHGLALFSELARFLTRFDWIFFLTWLEFWLGSFKNVNRVKTLTHWKHC